MRVRGTFLLKAFLAHIGIEDGYPIDLTAHARSLREGVDTSTPMGRAVTSIMATIAELELGQGRERRAASREARIMRGLPATKPMKLDAAQQKRLLRLYRQGEPVSELTTIFGISTLFRTLKVLKRGEPVSV